MLALEFQFPAGRYHATPWGRNVNEGVVEWPPSPFRIARALVDVCHRRRPEWTEERLAAVLRPLSASPMFRLPPATTSHIRAFLSSNQKDAKEKAKILDSFVAVDRGATLVAGFDAEVSKSVRADLSDLLGELSYLGRSESWVKARILDAGTQYSFNCGPRDVFASTTPAEPVQTACLCSEEEYQALPTKPCARRKGKGQRASEALSWLSAIGLSTTDLLAQGWSSPPALKVLELQRPVKAFAVVRRASPSCRPSQMRVARFAMSSTVLPQVTDTVVVAERSRRVLMGIHRKVSGGDPTAVSMQLAGKTEAGGPGRDHEHAFFLPIDEDGDGRIDHLLLRAPRGFDGSELEAVDRFRRLWQADGRPDINLVLVSLAPELPLVATRWVSATPLVIGRHHRKGRGTYLEWLEGEIRRECAFHNLAAPSAVEWITETQTDAHGFRWLEFVRCRKGGSPLQGHGCRLTFDEPVRGPFALGSLSHFGLGLFVPVSDKG